MAEVIKLSLPAILPEEGAGSNAANCRNKHEQRDRSEDMPAARGLPSDLGLLIDRCLASRWYAIAHRELTSNNANQVLNGRFDSSGPHSRN